MSTPKTNGDFLADLYRQEYALRSPKAHIPLGIGVFMILAAVSPIAWLPFAGAGLVAYDAERRLRKNRKTVEVSYRNPEVLFSRLKKDEQELVSAFLDQYPIDSPFGTKKALPPHPPKADPSPACDDGGRPQPNHFVEANKMVDDHIPDARNMVEGWQPQPLPTPFVAYLGTQIHILIAATTGSGKTWLLRSLCSHLANRGDMLIIADPKGTQWGDLAPAVRRMKTGMDYAALVKDLHKELESRIDRFQDGKPVGPHLWCVFDEWFLAKGRCGMLDNDARKGIEIRLLDIIAAGRELNVHLVIVGQSHLLGDLSLAGGKNTFSSGLRDNLCTLGLGCKATKDNAGTPMAGNSKSIDSMLADQALLRDANDRAAAQAYHAALRRQPGINRTFCLYAAQLFIGPVPDLVIPSVPRIIPFLSAKKDDLQTD